MLSLRVGSRLLPPRLAGVRGVSAAAAVAGRRSFAVTARRGQEAAAASSSPSSSATGATDKSKIDETTAALAPRAVDDAPAPATTEIQQAPNRVGVWTRNQQPRDKAMTGPRFEQTDFSLQPQPYSAMELIHQQPVRWTHDRIVSCDGGGGPNGHPRIFINTDKPQIAVCGYCGLPFANEHHRKHLESLPQTSYPLS